MLFGDPNGMEHLTPVNVIEGSNGNKRLERISDKKIASVQPEGWIEWRDPGTNGPYEQCTAVVPRAVFQPTAEGGWFFALVEGPQ